MRKVLFYLPVVTPWWFDTIVTRLIKALAVEAEVHVLVPPLWRNTGIGPAQLEGCAALTDVNWHIVNDDFHPSLRTSPTDPDGVVDFVRSIDPQYVFCRSADIATPSRFPGKVVHLMEAGASPFFTPAGWIILQREFWHHGAMPALSDDERGAIESMFTELWERRRGRFDKEAPFSLSRKRVLESMGLPLDRKIIALPLEYEHEEAFTAFHNRFERNIDAIHHVADALHEDTILAVNDHPLNYKYIDNSKVHAAIAALGSLAHLVPNPEAYNFRNDLLIKNCDGLIVQNTKAIYSGTFFGKPTLRLSYRPTAEWIGSHARIETFLRAVASGASGVSEEKERMWFDFQIMHEMIDSARISGAELLDRIDRPFSSDRLKIGLDRFEAQQRELDVAA